MAQTGHLALFTDKKPADIAESARLLAGLFGATRTLGASFAKEPIHNYDDFLRFLSDDSYELPYADYPVFFAELSIDEWQSKLTKYAAGNCGLRPENGRTKLIFDAIKRDIPPSISNNAYVSEPSLYIGGVDWFDEEKEGAPEGYFGRSEIAVSLYGYFTPHNWDEYRRLIWEIPEIVRLQADVEAILGPVKRCIYWSV